jgi:hypothetical protein
MLAMRLNVAAERSEAMCRYFRDDALPRAMASIGVLACHLCGADASASYVNTAESSTREFDVPPWILLCEASTAAALEGARNVIDGRQLERLGVEVRKDAAVYALEICRLSAQSMHR